DGARQPGTDTFRLAVSSFIEQEFKGFAGWVQIIVGNERIRVSWRTKPEAPTPLSEAISRVQSGDLLRGIQVLKLILAAKPDDAVVRYTLGTALSDAGKLDEAERHLRAVVENDPNLINARVALGVALMRKREFTEAEIILES